MKKFKLVGLLLAIFSLSIAQTPEVEWSKVMGGSADELEGAFAMISLNWGRHAAVDVDKINDNIYIATTSRSSDHYLHQNYGEEDIWVICLNPQGDTLWTKTLGGSSWERVHRARALENGGFIIVGSSHSSDETFSNSISNYYDAFVIKFNQEGDIVWNRRYGGNFDDFLFDIIETSDGHLLACGESYSFTGDLATSGDGMNWALKLNPENGNVVWSKTYLGPDGSSSDWLENVYRLTELANNSVIMTGFTTPDFNNFNLDRINIISIDLDGELNWMQKIGDTGSGDYPAAIVANEDGDFYILGKLAGDLDGGYDYYGGGGDFWLVKMNSDGDILWEQNYGGSNLDVPYDLRISSAGDIYMVGLSRSYDHDAYEEGEEAPEGWVPTHYWLLKTNQNGEVLYNKKLGGTSNDFATGIALSNNEQNIYLVGASESDDGVVGENLGGRDLWLVSLMYDDEIIWGCTDPLAINYNPDATHDDGSCEYDDTFVSTEKVHQFAIYPNPGNGIVSINSSENVYITITDIAGKTVHQGDYKSNHTMDVSFLSKGVYLISARGENINDIMRLIIQ